MAGSVKMMNAWKVRIGEHQPHRTKVPIPTPEPDGLLVKLQAMGVCHSDCTILAMEQTMENWHRDFILGHEGAGEIVEVGANVDKSLFQVGDKVAIHIIPGCDRDECLECSRGLKRLCRSGGAGNYGLGRDGMFAEYVAVTSRAAVKVPTGVSIEQAATAADAMLTAYEAVKHAADVKPNHTVLVFGLGGLGFNAIQILRSLGVKRLLVCDRRREVVDAAIKLGIAPDDAFCTGDADAPSPEAVIAEKKIVVDTVIDFVGHGQTFASAQSCVRLAGTIVMVGLISPQVALVPMQVVTKNLTIKGTYNGTMLGLKECLNMLHEGVVKPDIVTGSIENLPAVLQDLDDGKIKGRMVLLPTWKS